MNKFKQHSKQAGLIVGLFFLTLIFQACGSDPVIASVDDLELTENDAYVLMKHSGLDPENKKQRSEFIDDWVNSRLYLEEISSTFPDEWNLIRLRSESFSADLAKYYLEEQLISKELDTIVGDEEVMKYYNEHSDEFVLQDYLVRGLYLKIPKEADFKSKKINYYYLLKNDKDLVQVDSYAKLYAQNYYYNDSSWIYFNELVKDVPLRKYNRDNIVLNRSKTYFSDDEFTYFINIIDFKLKDEAPPIEFLQEEIREIIIAHRLQDLKEKKELNYLNELKEKHEVTINH